VIWAWLAWFVAAALALLWTYVVFEGRHMGHVRAPAEGLLEDCSVCQEHKGWHEKARKGRPYLPGLCTVCANHLSWHRSQNGLNRSRLW
jgi:hypothetical protein